MDPSFSGGVYFCILLHTLATVICTRCKVPISTSPPRLHLQASAPVLCAALEEAISTITHACVPLYSKVTSASTHSATSYILQVILWLCRAPLQFEDIWDLPPDDRVDVLAKRFRPIWKEQLGRRGGPSLVSTPPPLPLFGFPKAQADYKCLFCHMFILVQGFNLPCFQLGSSFCLLKGFTLPVSSISLIPGCTYKLCIPVL